MSSNLSFSLGTYKYNAKASRLSKDIEISKDINFNINLILGDEVDIPNNDTTFAAIRKEVDAVTDSQVVFELNKTHLSYSFLALIVLVIASCATSLYRRYKKKENKPGSVQCEYVTLQVTENQPTDTPSHSIEISDAKKAWKNQPIVGAPASNGRLKISS